MNITNNLHNSLIEELTEHVDKTHEGIIRVTTYQWAWNIGETIARYIAMGWIEPHSRNETGITAALENLSKDVNRSPRKLQQSLEFFRKVPDLDLLMDAYGNNLNLTIINEHILPALPAGETLDKKTVDELSKVDFYEEKRKKRKESEQLERLTKSQQTLIKYNHEKVEFNGRYYVPFDVIERLLSE